MKIDHVSSKLYHVPPTVPWEDATHKVGRLEFVVTTLETDSGLTGTGYAYTTGVGGSAIAALIDDYCAGMLVGQDPMRIEHLGAMLNRQLHRTGTGGTNTLALGAIDIGLWDIAGQALGRPVHALLGSGRDSIPVYGSGIDIHLERDALLAEVEGFLAQGFATVKIKIGRADADDDLERVQAVRRLIGRDRRLLVDANQRWTVSEALPRLQKLQGQGLSWVEEPLHAEDIGGHVEIRHMTGLPMAIGESLYTRHQFRDYLAAGAVDIVQADVCRVGGISEWLKIAHLASSFHRPIAPHYAAEISLGPLCAVDNGLMLEWVHGGNLSEMGLLVEPMRIVGGNAIPSERPGNGIRFDPAALARFEVDAATLRSSRLHGAK